MTPGNSRGFLISVGGRLLVPLALTATVVLTVHAILGYRLANEHFLRNVRANVSRHSTLVKQATHDGMLLSRLDEVQAIVERLAEGPQVAAIRFYDKQGKIVLSAVRDEIGQQVPLDSETCGSCHDYTVVKDDAMLERSSLTRLPDGPEVFRKLTVIENEPECSNASCHYHPPDQRVLGVLDVEMSMVPFQVAVAAARTQTIWTTVVLILITGLVTALVIRRVVEHPVHQLYEGTRRITRGDLDTHIDVRGGHELALLAEAFNQMVENLRIAQAELSEWSRTLEEQVSKKTDELQHAQDQMLHMEKMTSLGKLSASVAHELNNPLGSMLTYARLIRRELVDLQLDPEALQELDKYAAVIDKEAKRCGKIVTNLVAFARRNGAEMVPIDLSQVVERSLLLVQHHLKISEVELQSERPAQECRIVADADQLEQALVALLVNAVEAMKTSEQDRRELTVRLQIEGDEVWIEVCDTGPGIPSDVLPHVFEPFYTTKKESGAGLGLSVVFGIAHRHGGSVEVESEPGRGTTFRLHLPREQQGSPEEVPPHEPPSVLQGQED